jgi:hypothetical protein
VVILPGEIHIASAEGEHVGGCRSGDFREIVIGTASTLLELLVKRKDVQAQAKGLPVLINLEGVKALSRDPGGVFCPLPFRVDDVVSEYGKHYCLDMQYKLIKTPGSGCCLGIVIVDTRPPCDKACELVFEIFSVL